MNAETVRYQLLMPKTMYRNASIAAAKRGMKTAAYIRMVLAKGLINEE
jgi:hypothetical protein